MISGQRADGSEKLRSLPRLRMEDVVDDENLLFAGHPAAAGRYRRVDVAWGETIELAHGELAPASFDGKVAVYEKLPTWNGARKGDGSEPVPIGLHSSSGLSLRVG